MASYEKKHCDTVEDFWEAIVPDDVLSENSEVFYRGHADSEWTLTPSILRDSRRSMLERAFSDFSLIHEWNTIRQFIDACDRARIAIPNDSRQLRRLIAATQIAEIGEHEWPLEQLYDVIAVMQHFGYPTRFLDWTRSPYVAAFFAANEIVMKPEIGSKNMAVFILDAAALSDISPTQVELVKLPPNNHYLSAQFGVFTLQKKGGHDLASFFNGIDDYAEPAIRKITTPSEHALEIMERCRRVNITHATIFPDYAGAVAELNYKRALQR